MKIFLKMIIIHPNFNKESKIKYKITTRLIKKRVSNYLIHLKAVLINFSVLEIIQIFKVTELRPIITQKVNYLIKINKIY